MSLVRSRLEAAAIPLAFPPEGTATTRLGALVPWWLMSHLFSHRASSGPNPMCPSLARAYGLGPLPTADVAHAMHAMIPVVADTSPAVALVRRGKRNAQGVSAIWQLGRLDVGSLDVVRDAMRSDLHSTWDDARYEALVGLLALGIDPGDVPAITRLLGHSDDAVRAASAAVLVRHAPLALHDDAVEDALSDVAEGEPARQLLDVARGNLEIYADMLDGGSWEGRMGLYLVGAALALQGESDHETLLEVLVSRVSAEDDSDAAVALSWALGATADRLGLDAARAVLAAAGAASDGSWQQGVSVLALLAVQLPVDEAHALAGELSSLSTSDNDTNDALALVRAHLLGGAIPWRAALRWNGVRSAVLNPLRPDTAFFGAMLSPDLGLVRAELLGATSSEGFWGDALRAQVIGWVLANDPTSVALLEELARSRAAEAAGPVSAALLLHEGPANLDPVVARMEIGPMAGGPLPDTPAVWGRLLRGLQESRIQDSARQLLRMCPVGSQVAEAWFHAGSALTGDDEEIEKCMAFARSLPQRVSHAPVAALERAAVGAKIDASTLLAELRGLSPEASERAFLRMVTSVSQRESLLALARGASTTNLSPSALTEAFWSLAHHSSWVQREAAGAIAQAMPPYMLDGLDDVKERLVELCRDHDSDVQREARAAARLVQLSWERDGDEEETTDDDLPF